MATIIGTEKDDIGTLLQSLLGGVGHILIGEQDEENSMYGLEGNDGLIGGGLDDYIDGGEGADIMDGQGGNDVYIVDNAADDVRESANAGIDEVIALVSHTLAANVEKLTLGATAGAIDGTGNGLDNEISGNDFANTLDGRDGDDDLYGKGGEDTLFGGAGDDHLFGGAHNDTLVGGLDNDTLDGGAGADQMFGGSGDDIYYVNNSGDVVSEFLGSGYDTVFSSISFTLPTGIEALVLEGFANDGTGNALANTIVGNERGNILNGLGGNDELYGMEGNDTVDGGFGDDSMAGGDNTDTLNFTSWDPTGFYSPVLESIRIDLGLGTATRTVTNPTSGTTSVVETDTFSEFENVRGSNRAETIVGNNTVNVLEGRGSDDVLEGKGGSDTLDGGEGSDTASYENNVGRVIVTLGSNGANGTAVEFALVNGQLVPLSGDTLRSIENVRGSSFADQITGNASDNVIDGRGGADVMMGLTGNDTYVVDNPTDVVAEAVGQGTLDRVRTSVSYALAAGSEVEILETTNRVGTTTLSLTGNEFNNTIVGNNGQNTIVGGLGQDFLTGNGGGDVFTWTSIAETNPDSSLSDAIVDFNRADGDLIALNLIDADETVAGNQAFTFIGSAAFTQAGQVRFFSDGSNTIILLNTNGSPDLSHETAIVLNGLHNPDASFFVL